jgi:ABC-type transport system involved in multi-copper enzyme maturation permease subunit
VTAGLPARAAGRAGGSGGSSPRANTAVTQLLRAEWIKFRSVRGWVIGMIVAVLATVGLGLLIASGSVCSVGPFPGHPQADACSAPLGPGGVVVTDSFYFVHQPLTGNGSLTVRVTALTGVVLNSGAPGLQPWSKAGIIVKQNLRPGSAYAAMLVTGGHGVRMQYDYTHDVAGLAGAVSGVSPRWLRLVRSGDTLTGYESADGIRWARVAAATLPGLPVTVQAGLFATSPPAVPRSNAVEARSGDTRATATFDRVRLTEASHRTTGARGWAGTDVGAPPGPLGAGQVGAFHRDGGTFMVGGSGDIAPSVSPRGVGTPLSQTLIGAFAGLIAIIVVATMFITAEYRHGLIRVTLAASPRRGRVLAAKAIVIGSVTFVAGLVSAAAAIPLGEGVLRRHGNFIAPVPALTELRVIAGTAALLAVAAVLALALGAVLRRSAAAVTTVIALIVLPYLLAGASPALPAGAADWLLRVTPAAAFAVETTSTRYPQVSNDYLPFFGYYPLGPWAGLAVLCGYAAAALALAAFLLRRRDA